MSAQPAAVARDGEQPWLRVHPITPYLRGWLAIVIIAVSIGRGWLDGFWSGEALNGVADKLPLAILVVLLVLAIVVGLFYLSWRFTKYRVTPTHVELRRGVIMRQHREARLDRVQAVDVVRPLLPRLLGLSELRFEVADGGDSALRLEYLSARAAEELRAQILGLAAGLRGEVAAGREHSTSGSEAAGVGALGAGSPDAGSAGAAPVGAASQLHRAQAAEWARRTAADLAGRDPAGLMPGGTQDETVLVQVPTGRLIGSALLNAAPWVLTAAAACIVATLLLPGGVVFALLVPSLLGVGGALWGTVNREFRFRAAVSNDGLRLRHGLTESQHRTVPPGRVQAVRLRRPLLWRPFGWVGVDANVAGYGNGESGGDAQRSVLLPVGTLAEATAVLSVVVPDPGVGDPHALIADGLDGQGPGAFVTTPRSARWLAPLAWRRQGYFVTATVLALRTGRLRRSLVLVPHARTQGMSAAQGVLARSAGVADVSLATTAGPVPTVLKQVAAERASELIAQQVGRAAQAAARQDSNHWLAEVADRDASGGAEAVREADTLQERGPLPEHTVQKNALQEQDNAVQEQEEQK